MTVRRPQDAKSNRVHRRPARIISFDAFSHMGQIMKPSAMVQLPVLAGAAVLEAALIPGILIGGVVVLAPKALSKFWPKRSRRPRPQMVTSRKAIGSGSTTSPARNVKASPVAPVGFALRRAILKTVTFRIIVTGLDFTTNYVVIGELAAAAGLSAIGLVAGPLFYFAHEMVWNRLGPSETVRLGDLMRPRSRMVPSLGSRDLTINRALAKTITFRTIATTMDFSANYFVVRDVATAAGLSAFGFVVGPFVYYGHEKAWDYLERLED
jgi:uncharacterized membrane protein